MSASLYTNPSGFAVTRHSYSAGSDFSYCSRLYKLKKLDGWREKETRASTKFGECIESAIQSHHAIGDSPSEGVRVFSQLWAEYQNDKTLTYTEKEGSWSDLHRMGKEMMMLYEIRLPQLGIHKPEFQLSYRKEVFPKTDLAGIEFSAYVDMRCLDKSGHKAIIDIKTSSTTLPDNPDFLRLDPQLRDYAWVTGIPKVGFLWFVKARPDSYKKGDEITLLVTAGDFKPGNTAIVLESDNNTQNTTLLTPKEYSEYEAQARGVKGKALDAVKNNFRLFSVTVPFDSVTKQRLQFLTTTISQEDIREAGETVGQEIKAIVDANNRGFWPKQPGIRYPNNKCLMCSMLPICSGNEKSVKERLYQINNPESEQDWLDELSS